MSLRIDPTEHGPVYGPDDATPRPGIVIVHGGEGPWAGWSHRFAVILAAHGFRALPVSYGEGDIFGAGPIREVPLEPLGAAIAALNALPTVTQTGAFGWSRGAEKLALYTALTGPDSPLKAIALHAGSDRIHSEFDPAVFRAGQGGLDTDPDAPAAWTWAGEPLRPGTPIEIESYPGPVFLSVGNADEIWDHRMTLTLADRLEQAGNPADLLIGPGQGHGLTFDYEPTLWARLTAFFHRHLDQ